MKYSTEYAAILATILTPLAAQKFSDVCAGEVSGVVAGTIITVVTGGYLLIKRYTRGGVTPLGVRK